MRKVALVLTLAIIIVAITSVLPVDAKKIDYTGLTPEQVAELKALRAQSKLKRQQEKAAKTPSAQVKSNVNTPPSPSSQPPAPASVTSTPSSKPSTTLSQPSPASLDSDSEANRRRQAGQEQRAKAKAAREAEESLLTQAGETRRITMTEATKRWAKIAQSEAKAVGKHLRRVQGTTIMEANKKAQKERLAKKAQLKKLAQESRAIVNKIESTVMKRKMTPEMAEKGERKLKFMMDAMNNSPNGIISMDTPTYKEFVHQGPRPYYTVVTFTALTSQHRCPSCHKFNDITHVPTARYFSDLYRKHPLPGVYNPDGSIASREPSEYPVFFVVVDAARASEVFQATGLQSVPVTILLPPASRQGKPKMLSEILTRVMPKAKLTATNSPSPNDLFNLVGRFTGMTYSPKPSVPILPLVLLVGGTLVAALLVYVAWDHLVILRNARLPYVLIAWLGYTYGTSGFMYNNLNGTPWSGRGRNNEEVFISGGGMDQYGAESVIIGFVNLSAAAATVAAILLSHYNGYVSRLSKRLDLSVDVATQSEEAERKAQTQRVKDTGVTDIETKKKDKGLTLSKDKTKGGESDPYATEHFVTEKVSRFLGDAIAPTVAFGLLVVAWFHIVQIYTYKNGHYNMGYVWRFKWR